MYHATSTLKPATLRRAYAKGKKADAPQFFAREAEDDVGEMIVEQHFLTPGGSIFSDISWLISIPILSKLAWWIKSEIVELG
jgi:hypothetical protein